jgi:hypothetical protein
MPPSQEPSSGSLAPHQRPPQVVPHRLQLPLAIAISTPTPAATLASTGSSTLHLHRQALITGVLQAGDAQQAGFSAARAEGGVGWGAWAWSGVGAESISCERIVINRGKNGRNTRL